MIVIPFQRTRGSFEWSDKHHTCVGWVSSHCQTGAESTAVFSILANKSLKHWGRATVGAVLAKKFADRYSCLMWFLMWCGEIFPEIVQTPQVHQVIQFHSVYCYVHLKQNAWGQKVCRNFGRKGTKICCYKWLVEFFYFPCTSLTLRHMQIHTQAVDPNWVYKLRYVRTSCALSTISNKLPTQFRVGLCR